MTIAQELVDLLLPSAGNYVATLTPPALDNSTNLATTAWVNSNAILLTKQTANYFLIGPTTGSQAIPTFRAVVPADIPIFGASGGSHASGAVPDPGSSAGTTRYLREDGTWVAPAGSGTVSSVALTVPGILYSVSGSPITGAGTLAISLLTQNTNLVLAGPSSGAPATPTFRVLAASDIPVISLATGITGTLAIANGGTGQTTAAAAFNALQPMTLPGDTIFGGTAGVATRLAGNTTVVNKFFTQTGTGSASQNPAWNTISASDLPASITFEPTLATGTQETGVVGLRLNPNATNAPTGYSVNYKTPMTNIPSSISLVASAQLNVAAGYPLIANYSKYGFRFDIAAATGGSDCYWYGTYTTVGN